MRFLGRARLLCERKKFRRGGFRRRWMSAIVSIVLLRAADRMYKITSKIMTEKIYLPKAKSHN